MRLHRLSLTGVGPFLRTQEIDFDDLSEAGLFLIDGPTGSGKTTIIDAIVYALFGDVSGGGDSDTARIRSSYCTDDDPTGVTLEFSVDGRRHRISRVPAGARDPQEPGRVGARKPARQVMTEFTSTGDEQLVLTRVGEIRTHIEALLAMTSEQFRHLVVLPQGKFADLLRMTPNDRLTELASLLDHREFFRRVQDDLKEQGAAAEDRRRAARDTVAQAAHQLAGRVHTHLDPDATVDFTDPAAPDAARTDAVIAVLERIGADLAVATQQRDRHQASASAKEAEATRARAVADALAEVGGAQDARARARAGLAPADADIDAAEVSARIGTLRTQEGALGELAIWESQAAARAQVRTDLMTRTEQAQREADELRETRANLPAQRSALHDRLTATQLTAANHGAATADVTRLDALLDRARARAAAEAELDALDSGVATATRTAEVAATTSQDAEASWRASIDLQRAHRAAALAAALAPGEPCPVCGSPEHPQPARLEEGTEFVTDDEVAEARDRADRAAATVVEASAALHRAQEARDACATRVASLTGALGDTTEADVIIQLSDARQRLQDASTAQEQLPAVRAELEELAARETAIGDSIDAAVAAAAQAAALVEAHDDAEAKEQARVNQAIGDAATATALLAATRERVARLEVLQAASERLTVAAAAVPPDQRTMSPADAEATAAAAEAASAFAAAALAESERVVSMLASTLDEAAPLADAFSEAMTRRARLDADTAAAVQLAQLAIGRNNRSLPLRSFALQRRFEAVLAAATVHLERMSKGKFSFELNEEVSRGQTGLGISVHDAWTGHLQDPKSLSGGETFYAALSLALGLADVVRGEAGGSALEILFIDEGFGSLDQDALYQVLDQLDHLRAGNRVIGVISHVTGMKESISERIDVRRGDDSTSTIRRAGER